MIDSDWRNLQKSELFDSIRSEIYMPKESGMFDVSDALIVDIDKREKTVGVKTEKEPLDNDSLKSYLQEHSKEAKSQQSKATGDAERKEPSAKLNKTINTVKPTKPSKPQLTFAEVKGKLTQSVITDIFHRYGPMMNNDAKIERKGDQLKLGSLYMSTSGSKAGLWNRFSRDGSKGDIFKFVEMATGCSKHEALEIVASHAGVVPSASNIGISGNSNKIEEKATQGKYPKTNKIQNHSVWAAHLTVPSSAPKFKPENDLSFLIKQGNEITSTYEYRNINNELLGYTLRIREKSSGSKQVLPVAYCHNEAQGKSRWQLKGISDNGTKPIYKLEQIAANPEKPILIVEGEKTADAASKLLPDYNVVSWIGGAQSVGKVDWSKLASKVVSIWPDNDQAGIGAASKIANHIDCQNGYSGLVSIVDTEKLSLPEKWDLADDVPNTSNLSKIGINGAIEEARVNNKNVGDLLEVSQGVILNLGGFNRVLGSIEMLIESNKLSKDEYTSKTIYSNNIDAIASARGIDLGNINDHKEFIASINDASYEYQSLQREYEQRQSQNQESDQAKTAKGQLCSDIVRDISILQQVQLGVRELTEAHRDHIESVVNSQLKDISDTRLNDSDKEMIANNVYKVVNSKEWRSELDAKQEQLAHSIRVKYTAKTIDEFLSSNNDKAISDLANIRSIGMDESGIFAAFKEDHNKGAQGLKELSDKVTIATGFAADNKAVIDEAKRFGYDADNAETIRSLVGMDKKEASKYINDICNDSLSVYFRKNLNHFKDKKVTFDFDQLKSIISNEQQFLKKTFESSNITKDASFLSEKNRDLMQYGQAISQNPEKLDEFFNKCRTIKDNNMTSEKELYFEMSYTRNIDALLEEAGRAIERHNIWYFPKDLAKIRSEAESIEGVFAAIEKEQNHLANQHGNIKHLDFETDLLAKCEVAYRQREDNSLDDLKDITNQALVSGAKNKDELIVDLQQVTDLKEAYTNLDQNVESHHINNTIANLAIQKQEAKSPDEILSIITKEQEFLSGLHGNIKYPENHPQELIDKCEIAHKQREGKGLDNLKDITNQALTSSAKNNEELVADLQQVTDLKEVYTKLDQDIESYHIRNTLREFRYEMLEAKTPADMLSIISSEQEFLSSLHDNIKYPERHRDIVNQCELAQKQKEDKSLDDLKDITNQALTSGAKSEYELVVDLSRPDNIKTLGDKIGGDIESYQFRKAINSFEASMSRAKNYNEALKALQEKEEYLVGINDIKYPSYVDKDILNAIEVAKENNKDKTVDELVKLVSFVDTGPLYKNYELLEDLQSPKDLKEKKEDIMVKWQNKYIENIKLNLSRIEQNDGKAIIDGKPFNGEREYLEHSRKCTNEYTPIQQLNEMHKNAVSKELEAQQVELREQEKDQRHQEQNQISKSMDFER